MPFLSALWRLDAFAESEGLDDDTVILVLLWLFRLVDEAVPAEAVETRGPGGRVAYRAIAAGTDIEVVWRVMATGSARLLAFRRFR